MGYKSRWLRSTKPAFSLPEIAIVVVIIGILAGLGSLFFAKGTVRDALIHQTIDQIKKIQISVQTFIMRYHSLPGDYAAASQVWNGATDGDGDNTVTGAGLATGSEALNFWHHLQCSGAGISIGKRTTSGNATFGAGAPAAPIGGGFTVETNPAEDLLGLWLILGKPNGEHGNGPLLTPEEAKRISQALGGSSPVMGPIRAKEGAGIQAGQCVSQGHYNLTVTSPVCVLYISL